MDCIRLVSTSKVSTKSLFTSKINVAEMEGAPLHAMHYNMHCTMRCTTHCTAHALYYCTIPARMAC